uniref:Uncharacterized protein n=1 Tax=Glossina brevipalpis TaxID=37001 RepID=A0A1A9WQE4_9MUSC
MSTENQSHVKGSLKSKKGTLTNVIIHALALTTNGFEVLLSCCRHYHHNFRTHVVATLNANTIFKETAQLEYFPVTLKRRISTRINQSICTKLYSIGYTFANPLKLSNECQHRSKESN